MSHPAKGTSGKLLQLTVPLTAVIYEELSLVASDLHLYLLLEEAKASFTNPIDSA